MKQNETEATVSATEDARHLQRVREGHGANCSSVGSVIDTLFLSAVAGGVVLAVIAAAMKREAITIVGEQKNEKENEEKNDASSL